MLRSTARLVSIVRLPSSSTAIRRNNTSERRIIARSFSLCGDGGGCSNSDETVRHWQRRSYATGPPAKKGFIGNLIETIQEEMAKNKDLKENLKKLKEETEKLEQSDALQKARAKYQLVEKETLRSTEVLKKQLNELHDKILKAVEDAKKSEMGEQVIKGARDAAERLEKSAEAMGKTATYKMVSESVQTIKHELDEVTIAGARIYRSPAQLRKRKELSDDSQSRVVEANTEATGLELHKDSRWYQSWKDFTDNNPYVNKLLDWKMRYEESENPVVRVARFFTDRIQSAASGLFSDGKLTDALTEIARVDPTFDRHKFLLMCEQDIIPNVLEATARSELDILKDWCRDRIQSAASGLFSDGKLTDALTEIARVDPTFDRHKFLLMCEQDIIPNVLEATARSELDILKDWCTERAFYQLSFPTTEAKRVGYLYQTKIVDVRRVDLVSGAVLDVGPTLIVQFSSQQFRCMRTPEGKVIEGHAERPYLVDHVWCLCRDMNELDTRAAWRVTEVHEHARLQLI